MDIAYNGYNKPTSEPNKSFPVTAIVFASLRLGDLGFKKIYDDMKDVRVLRVTNANDLIPTHPEMALHVGENLPINTRESPFLKSHVKLHILMLTTMGLQGHKGVKEDFIWKFLLILQ
ncbi:hypothetical protein P3X46_020229 [Hevea brasiliensis]|uniref:Phospholipase A1 n=1 Tax=Hevea brasiliensis TaxID=3981 RepID=A0ABQ9LL88_HEVBR|nr:hypothetical protein P3X46_020229 [Hevea brasiliensis]